MSKTSLLSVFATLILLTAVGSAEKKTTATKSTENSVVITFKDGHTQSFPVSDVARIEFEPSSVEPVTASSGHFLGRWKVGDGVGGSFYITLKRDGHAYKTLGDDYGSWTVVGDEARITWEDGWRDTIRKAGNRYEKVAYHPGKTFADMPDHIADATSTDPI